MIIAESAFLLRDFKKRKEYEYRSTVQQDVFSTCRKEPIKIKRIEDDDED